MASGRFKHIHFDEFLATFQRLTGDENVIDSILQISTDEGEELEIGFFTSNNIADVTLSNGRVYSYVYPVSKVLYLNITDTKTKWVLTINGEKKFDYNVVKPAPIEEIRNYEASLRQYLDLA